MWILRGEKQVKSVLELTYSALVLLFTPWFELLVVCGASSSTVRGVLFNSARASRPFLSGNSRWNHGATRFVLPRANKSLKTRNLISPCFCLFVLFLKEKKICDKE